MAKLKAWKEGADGEPAFPAEFEVLKKAVLQVTDLKTNRNKYYAIELHSAEGAGFRVFTHYGRTDDLEANPDSGQKESRYCTDLAEAEGCYGQIYRQKTSKSKGYAEVSLASVRIGSIKARGTSAGDVDAKTLEIAAEAERARDQKAKAKTKPKGPPPLKLHADVKDLVQYIFAEATTALTNTVQAKITANGIETPLGILTIGQIEKGERVLIDLAEAMAKRQAKARKADALADLTGRFYSAIPHRVGRTRAAALASVINSPEALTQKQETLQLMRDMLRVNGEEGSVLFDAEVDGQYRSLGCDIVALEPSSKDYRRIEKHVIGSQVKMKSMRVRRIWTVRRPEEHDRYVGGKGKGRIGNEQNLFHGSRLSNWVGLLSRGILMPKLVTKLGVRRTDAGWLGHGIYFGDAACTSAFYAAPGKRRTQLLTVARVALGKPAQFKKITHGLTEPPAGHDSCHGVRGAGSQFADDEFVIYDPAQYRMDHLVEFTH
jgi:poly [ADP-ribose] polymerase